MLALLTGVANAWLSTDLTSPPLLPPQADSADARPATQINGIRREIRPMGR